MGVHGKIMTENGKNHSLEASLEAGEDLFRQVTESIDEIFILAKPRLERVLYVSPSYERVWGDSCDALYASPQSRLEAVYTDDRLRIMAYLERKVPQKYEIEYRVQQQEGDVRWVRERGFPIAEETGQINRIAIIISDITEEKQLREEAEVRLQQIVQADRLAALGEVVAGVAHEINNPNSFITYNIPLLEETWRIFKPIIDAHAKIHAGQKVAYTDFNELMEDMEEIIKAIKIGSERINRVVSNLKDFARLDESTHNRPVDVNDVIEKTMTIVGAQLRRCAEDITVSLSNPLPSILGQAQKLEQVVANLLVNSARALPAKSGGRITVATRYLERLSAVVVEIEDNGRGMPANILGRIFEPFFTTRRAAGGTGLGLSVSYGLVREHQGTIGVMSRPKMGTRFTVYLPTGTGTSLNLHPTILCVDDNEMVLGMVRSMLIKVEDEFVETTARPEQVVEFLESHPEVDIVLSDVSMPGLNGWDLLEKIKQRFPLIAVILYSGLPDALESPDNCYFQPDAVLHKPFEKFELVQILSSIGRQRL